MIDNYGWKPEEVGRLLFHRGSPTEDIEILLLCMCDRQTEDEKDIQLTTNLNGIGFNQNDAPVLTSIGQQITLQGRGLTQAEIILVRRKLHKYKRQLADALNAGEVELTQTRKWYVETLFGDVFPNFVEKSD